MTKLTTGQREVLKAFAEFNKPIDDVVLSVYVHHASDAGMSSSGVRTRRNELERKGFIMPKGQKVCKSGRHATVYGLTAKGRKRAVNIV